jgi:hypothetical protein
MSEEKVDWAKTHYKGQMPLYEAILMYMLESRVVPAGLVQEFTKAINKYEKGETDDLEIGLDFFLS